MSHGFSTHIFAAVAFLASVTWAPVEARPSEADKAPSSARAANKAQGLVDPYDASALKAVRAAARGDSRWPAWREKLARWEWGHIRGSDIASVKPSQPVQGSGGLRTRIDAWNGLAADVRSNRLYSAANGGHADYAGNEVYEIDLSRNAPQWKILREPTPAEQVLASNYTKRAFHDYYSDGRPAATHTYYALQFIASRNAIFKFGAGSLWGTGNESNWKIDAFSLSNDDWHPAGTWPEVVPESRKGALGASICKHPRTEEVYISAPGNIRRFSPESGKLAVLARWVEDSTAVYARACAVDPLRKRIVYFGDAYRTPHGGLLYDIARNTLTKIRFNGEHAADITRRSYHAAWFDSTSGKFLLKTGKGDRVYSIDPESFLVELLATTGGEKIPDAVNGVHTRWQYLPGLGGYAYYPRGGSGIWFLAAE